MAPAMKPSDAYECLAHHHVDRVGIDDLVGRITTMLVTPYPPGIPLLIPGERFNATIVEYLKFARSFNERFPGFDTDVHGLVREVESGRASYYVDCVRQGERVAAVALRQPAVVPVGRAAAARSAGSKSAAARGAESKSGAAGLSRPSPSRPSGSASRGRGSKAIP